MYHKGNISVWGGGRNSVDSWTLLWFIRND
jgi:hypothetical protein